MMPIVFELIALLIGMYVYKQLDRPLRLLVFYLGFVLVVEVCGWFIRHNLHVSNSWLYNLSVPVEFMMYTYLFYSNLSNRNFKLFAKGLLIAIPVGAIINMVFVQGFWLFNTNTLLGGQILMIILCCLFLTDLLMREKQVFFLKLPMFWITTGLLFFNLGELSYSLMFDYILKNEKDRSLIIFTLINHSLIYVLYTLISIGLLCDQMKLNRHYRQK